MRGETRSKGPAMSERDHAPVLPSNGEPVIRPFAVQLCIGARQYLIAAARRLFVGENISLPFLPTVILLQHLPPNPQITSTLHHHIHNGQY
jgi:hypothetical protein